MNTTEWLVLTVSIIGFIAYKFYRAFSADNKDLKDTTLDEKYITIVKIINKAVFNNSGVITTFDKREFDLTRNGDKQNVNFRYGSGHLTLHWKYQLPQKEVSHKKQLSNARNLDESKQKEFAEKFVRDYKAKLKRK